MFLKLYGDHSYKRKKERKKHLSLSFAFQTIHGILEKSRFCRDIAVKCDSQTPERMYGFTEGKPLSELWTVAKAAGEVFHVHPTRRRDSRAGRNAWKGFL